MAKRAPKAPKAPKPAETPDTQTQASIAEVVAAAPARVSTKDEQRAYHLAALAALDAPEPVRFPKWKHSPTEGKRVVDDAASEVALGPGWFDSPDQFPQEKD
jgi:hypothetical protein